MRFLLINYEYPPVGAGAANATRHIAQELCLQGHSVGVLTARYGELRGWRDEDGIPVFRCAARRTRPDQCGIGEMLTFIAGATVSLRRVIRRLRPETCIVFFSIPCGPLGLLAKFAWGVPYVTSLRGGDVPGSEPGLTIIYKMLTPLRRMILRQSVAVVANSHGLKELSERADPIPVLVIPNGVDTDYFRPAPVRDHGGAFRILFVGRFQRAKNILALLDEVAALVKRLPEINISLDLIGDGPLRGEIERKIAALDLGGRVTLYGWISRPQLLAAYQRADCLVNPSLYEGMSNVVLEAMACGLPVLASRVAGNDSVVRDQENGFLFDLTDPAMLAKRLDQMARNRALCQSLGARGRLIALADYSWNSVAQQYVDLFAE